MGLVAGTSRVAQSLSVARVTGHRWGGRCAFLIDSACVAFMSVGLVTFAMAGFDLVRAGRLWGGFWTHFADAPQAAREPVAAALLASWAVLTLITALIRAPRKRAPETREQEDADV